jgi:predicted acyltransferase
MQPTLAGKPTTTINPAFASTPVKRLLSLDVVRGIIIAFMIMVNNNGGPGSWHFMNHAEWNGLTPTDLVFPTFVFIVGVSIVFAFEARLARGDSRAQLARHTVQRAAILVVLGIIVNSFPFFALAHMRFYGVLQRIAVCYLVVGLFYLWDQRVSTKVIALVASLVGYWILARWVSIPGVGLPGRDVPFLDMTQNLVSWVDRHLFPYHLYLYAPDHNVRDPEGLLSDLPAIGTALMGVLTGLWLRSSRSIPVKTVGLAAASLGSLALGYLWSLEFPLNKNMWTSSFVLVAAGYSLALLTFVFWAVEQQGWRKGWTWPWLVFGSNAIAAYMFSELVPGIIYNISIPSGDGKHASLAAWLASRSFGQVPDPAWAAFAYSVSFTAFCFIPVWILYRKKIFLKI